MAARELSASTINALRRIAGRCCAVPHEAEDLMQDILLAAIEAGRDCGDPGFLPWASGAIRNRAKFTARTAVRRKRRERIYAREHEPFGSISRRLPDELIRALPRSRRLVALLINLGMGRHEIAYLLDLSNVALRQRIAGVRKALAGFADTGTTDQSWFAAANGTARRALRASLPKRGQRRFAVRDPDGLPIFFAGSDHVSKGRGNQ